MNRGNDKFFSQVYTIFDFIFIQIAFLFSWWLKFKSNIIPFDPHLAFDIYLPWGGYYGIIAIIVGYMISLYSPSRKKSLYYDLLKISQLHVISMLALLSLLFFFRAVDISRHFLAIFLISSIVSVLAYRCIVKLTMRKLRNKENHSKKMLILGAGTLGRTFYDNLVHQTEHTFNIIGFLDDYQSKNEENFHDTVPILGKTNQLEEIVKNILVDEVIIALPLIAHNKIQDIINVCEKYGIRALIIPDYYDYLPAKPHFDMFGGMPLINIRDVPLDELRNKTVKRLFDIVFSLTAIILVSPVLVIIALGVKLTSPGPIIFKQERVGLNRRNFMMYKFRSMRALQHGTVDTGWTTSNDPRKTKFGAFLRKTSLDELPQFFNVLLGHMSVVGPRPERPYFVEQFKEEIPKYMVKHHIRPGITGWAQTNGLRGDTSIEERIKHDIFYIENWNFLLDIKIIFKTIINGFINKNAY